MCQLVIAGHGERPPFLASCSLCHNWLTLTLPRAWSTTSPDPCADEEDAESDRGLDSKFLTAWSKQDIDQKSTLLGTTAPFLRHILVSTGQTDWAHDVTSVNHSVAARLENVASRNKVKSTSSVKQWLLRKAPSKSDVKDGLPEGCWQLAPADSSEANTTTEIKITNSSHISASDESHKQSIFVFPDWISVSELISGKDYESEEDELNQVYEQWLAPDSHLRHLANGEKTNAPAPQHSVRSVLPYSAVILLCAYRMLSVSPSLSMSLISMPALLPDRFAQEA